MDIETSARSGCRLRSWRRPWSCGPGCSPPGAYLEPSADQPRHDVRKPLIILGYDGGISRVLGRGAVAAEPGGNRRRRRSAIVGTLLTRPCRSPAGAGKLLDSRNFQLMPQSGEYES